MAEDRLKNSGLLQNLDVKAHETHARFLESSNLFDAKQIGCLTCSLDEALNYYDIDTNKQMLMIYVKDSTTGRSMNEAFETKILNKYN